MSEKGKDKLFLAYANYSLRVDPKNFLRIYDLGDRCYAFTFIDKNRLRAQVETIVECEYSKKSFVESVISRKPDPNVRVIYSDMDLKNAIEALYVYRDGFCENECPLRKVREEKWGKDPFEGPDRWKCIECDQCDFVRVLMDIMDGIPYSEIDGLLPKPYLKIFEEILDPPLDEGSSKSLFREYWNTLIGDDLVRFLNKDDNNWRRLKLCPYCNEFFIASDAKKERCYSTGCNRKYYRWYMREYRKLDG